jgi:S-adenosylmethionine:tRNA ribosyltransferase-isomerase
VTWSDSQVSFAEIIRSFGELPCHPTEKKRHQGRSGTVSDRLFGERRGRGGSYGGLHFTPRVLEELTAKGIATDFLTLHVGRTFQPIKPARYGNTPCTPSNWYLPKPPEELAGSPAERIAVGTTSLRSLESLYWYGVKLLLSQEKPAFDPSETEENRMNFRSEKLYSYSFEGKNLPSAPEAIGAVLTDMQAKGRTEIMGETEILMAPGYSFRVGKGLVTNYTCPEPR